MARRSASSFWVSPPSLHPCDRCSASRGVWSYSRGAPRAMTAPTEAKEATEATATAVELCVVLPIMSSAGLRTRLTSYGLCGRGKSQRCRARVGDFGPNNRVGDLEAVRNSSRGRVHGGCISFAVGAKMERTRGYLRKLTADEMRLQLVEPSWRSCLRGRKMAKNDFCLHEIGVLAAKFVKQPEDASWRCLGDYLGWRYKAQGQGAAGKRFISPEAGL